MIVFNLTSNIVQYGMKLESCKSVGTAEVRDMHLEHINYTSKWTRKNTYNNGTDELAITLWRQFNKRRQKLLLGE